MNHVAVILAGGSGRRLWPLSRADRPKQLLRIVEGRSLLRHAYDRLRLRLAPSDIFVVALERHLDAIAGQLEGIPRENLIGEPVGRDTANAIALAAAILNERRSGCTMGVFTADHLIRPIQTFSEIVARGYEAAETHADALVTFGIRPTEPSTQMGYIERGEPVSPGVFAVKSFREKPDAATAKQYMIGGAHDWNSGMFVWRLPTIVSALQRHLPQAWEALARVAPRWGSEAGTRAAAEVYPTLTKTSIDYAVMEKAAKVLVVEMPLEWHDLGHWTSLPAVVGADGAGNTISATRVAALAAKGNIVVSEEDHLIAAIGVSDLVIVQSADATLICHKSQIDRLKDLLDEIGRDYGTRYE
ncbi:MAG: mannose-1-phosphate guanylyltransferase [Phycisphaerae bacterium]|nr:MAG: mannose-1-phosphate guanylyltransferase [Planctomycetia bacterium]RIK66488.1 MAG: mannose-1-phosphate guanyltransferase [Planctomycetota bacterium]GJQ25341.1 MAG: mannose-1-phosphate guanylyltransferase [Phycisphaerae bacterium]